MAYFFFILGIQVDAKAKMVHCRQWHILQINISNGKERPNKDGHVAVLGDAKQWVQT